MGKLVDGSTIGCVLAKGEITVMEKGIAGGTALSLAAMHAAAKRIRIMMNPNNILVRMNK